MTSAASDLAVFISKYTNGKATIMYGVSYGTMFAERLMHLAPPEVTGYVLDGVATMSEAPADKFPYFSNWDLDFGEVGDVFLSLCEEDSNCKDRFRPTSLNSSLQKLIDQFDRDPNSTCAVLVNSTQGHNTATPSSALRYVLGRVLTGSYMRTFIPPVVYRLQRCLSQDFDVLRRFFTSIGATTQSRSEDSAFESTLLYGLIVYSEGWQSPLPSMSEMTARFTNAKMSSGRVYAMGPQYCAFSKEKSKACDEFNVSNYDASGIVYKRDQYWNTTATIPNQASVLLMSGKLDSQTPNKYAEALFNSLHTEKKELIAFDYAPHNTVMTTQMIAGRPRSETCGMKVLASYVRYGGDLTRLDKSCIKEMTSFNLTTPDAYLAYYFGTKDAYDGVFDSSLISN